MVALGKDWAVILGASSGFGAATAVELARSGLNIAGVHLDRRAALPAVQALIAQIQASGCEALFFNVNAADEPNRRRVVAEVRERMGLAEEPKPGDPVVRVLVHSLAFGTLKSYVADAPSDRLSKAQMDMTLDVMAHSLVYWAQDLVAARMLRRGSRIFAMTSAGSHRVVPYYGLVSAAKAALESHIRQLAFELAPLGITANSIQAGLTLTPALDKIRGHETLEAHARERNPSGRLTTATDVAGAISLLVDPRADWITGNVIAVDGGEDIVG